MRPQLDSQAAAGENLTPRVRRLLDFLAQAAPAALALMVAALSAFALVGMTASRDAVQDTTQLQAVGASFDQAGAQLAHEERLLDELETAVENETVGRVFAARAQFDVALDRAIREGDSRTRATAEALRAQHLDYGIQVDHVIAALRSGDRREAHRIQDGGVDRIHPPLVAGLRRAATASDRASTVKLGALDSLAQSLFVAGIVASALAIALVCGLYVIFGLYRRREERTRSVELARLEHAALTDNLTGLHNHRAFQEDLKRLSAESRAGEPLTLLVFDLDGLKLTNDTYGHEAGDERLKAVADGLRNTLRGDSAYRLGGDEFAVILAGEPRFAGVEYAQRLQAQLAASGDGITSVTAGCAQADHDTPPDVLLSRADAAMISAKRLHRGVLTWSLDLELTRAEVTGRADRHQVEVLATSLARAVDAKDSYTRSHCETVSELCATIGVGFGMAPERVAKLRIAGLLHDVGKIGIPDAILQKPGPLTDEEYDLMQTHAQLGGRILAGAELKDEAHWVLHHHERIDGLGYPDGMSGDEIPLESRIIIVADAYEALTSDRPYRPGRARSAALAELECHAGTHFDAECVATLRQELVGREDPVNGNGTGHDPRRLRGHGRNRALSGQPS